jgi:iron(III) transport system substrate-binding protein
MRTLRIAAGCLLAWAGGAIAAEPAAVDAAKREGKVLLYTSMQLVDSGPLTQAFEKKYGIKVDLWRASGEKVVQRALTESRAGRREVDVFETDGAQMEILHREKQLARYEAPTPGIPPEIIPAHRDYVPTRVTLYVLAWNTKAVKPEEVPAAYTDLLDRKWAGRFGIEAADVAWFAAVTKAMGEAQGLEFFRKLAAQRPSMRNGHTLMAELVAAGDIAMAVDAHVQGVARLKARGAPIEWKPLQPAFGQPSSIGVARNAPHPGAARLFAEFVLSAEGQEIINRRKRVPASTAVDSPLNKFRYAIIDPAIMLDEWSRWEKLWSEIFLGGAAVKKEGE